MKTCPICRREWDDEFQVCPIDGLKLQPGGGPSDPHIGKTVGRTRIVQKLGEGSLGPVYRGDDPALGSVAIQITPGERVASPVLLETFQEAVKAAIKLNHPNIVRVFALETAATGDPAVVMEYVPGASLEDYRKQRQQLEVSEGCALVRQAAEGVMTAHRASILHGALHPSRITVKADGTVKIGGFHRGPLREGTDAGTADAASTPYLAPEQAGVVRDLPVPDYRADIYALGVILYELLAGRLPWEAKDPHGLATAMQSGGPAPPNFHNPQVSPTLARVVVKAIAKLPVDRYRTMDEFVRDLDAARQPFRPEREAAPGPPLREERATRPREAGLFSSVFGKKPRPADDWRDESRAGRSGDASIFDWFKTGVDRGRRGRRPARFEDSGVDDSRHGRRDDRGEDSVARTVHVSGRRRERERSRDPFDSFVSSGRDPEVSGTWTLPRRRLGSKSYIWIGASVVAVLAVAAIWFAFCGRPGSGPPDFVSGPSQSDAAGPPELPRSSEAGLPPPQAPVLPPYVPPPSPAAPAPVSPPSAQPFESRFNIALRSRNLFPPGQGNAWDTLQEWQRSGASMPATLAQAQQNLCNSASELGSGLLDQADIPAARTLLEQIRTRIADPDCGRILQLRYEAQLSRSLSDLRASLEAAINRQNFVTPEYDNAFKYLSMIRNLAPQDPDLRTRETDIFSRALEQARARSAAHQHQEALAIFTQLKAAYPSPPGGVDALNQGIERERRKLTLYEVLKQTYSIRVRHGHFGIPIFMKRECSGVLQLDATGVQYQADPPDHSFKLTYGQVVRLVLDKNKLTIEGPGVPGRTIELIQVGGPGSDFAEFNRKFDEYRKHRLEYDRL